MGDLLGDGAHAFPLRHPGPAQASWSFAPLLTSGTFSLGFAWNRSGDLEFGLEFGLAASISAGGGGADTPSFDPGLIAGLFKVQGSLGGMALGRPGHLWFTSHLPSPSFLKSVALGGEINPAGANPLQSLSLTVTDQAKPTSNVRSVNVPGNPQPPNRWDAVRLALFVIEAWLRSKEASAQPKDVVDRLNRHLLPLFGERLDRRPRPRRSRCRPARCSETARKARRPTSRRGPAA